MYPFFGGPFFAIFVASFGARGSFGVSFQSSESWTADIEAPSDYRSTKPFSSLPAPAKERTGSAALSNRPARSAAERGGPVAERAAENSFVEFNNQTSTSLVELLDTRLWTEKAVCPAAKVSVKAWPNLRYCGKGCHSRWPARHQHHGAAPNQTQHSPLCFDRSSGVCFPRFGFQVPVVGKRRTCRKKQVNKADWGRPKWWFGPGAPKMTDRGFYGAAVKPAFLPVPHSFISLAGAGSRGAASALGRLRGLWILALRDAKRAAHIIDPLFPPKWWKHRKKVRKRARRYTGHGPSWLVEEMPPESRTRAKGRADRQRRRRAAAFLQRRGAPSALLEERGFFGGGPAVNSTVNSTANSTSGGKKFREPGENSKWWPDVLSATNGGSWALGALYSSHLDKNIPIEGDGKSMWSGEKHVMHWCGNGTRGDRRVSVSLGTRGGCVVICQDEWGQEMS